MNEPAENGAPRRRTRRERVLLFAFLLSGGAALVYEVAWTRALSLVIGSTTYAVSTMLATFMAGLAIGAAWGGRVADRTRDRVAAFALCELGIGVSGVLSVPFIYLLPAAYLAIYRQFHLYPPLFFAFQILLCAAVMLVPTILMGATFPLVSRALAGNLDEVGREVGAAYSFNTLGAVVGSLAAGFALVPWLGLRRTVLVAGAVNLAVAASLLILARWRNPRSIAGIVLVAAVPLALVADARDEASVLNFYSAHRHLDPLSFTEIERATAAELETLEEGDWPEGHLRAFRTRDGHLLLQVGGKIEGTGARDVTNTLLLAYLPVAAHRDPQRMLVIGLGAGVTLQAAREAVPQVDLVEIHPGVLDVVQRFGPPHVLDGIRIVRDDARSFLLKSDERWDMISSEPSYPTEAVVSNLFTREYFELAASRLAPGGVYAQWLPYHILTNQDVTLMLRTFAGVFPHTYLWRIPAGLDLILLGSQTPFTRSEAEIRVDVERLNAGRWPLEYITSRTPAQVAEIVRVPGPIHTDDHPVLEFRIARNLVIGELERIEQPEQPTSAP